MKTQTQKAFSFSALSIWTDRITTALLTLAATIFCILIFLPGVEITLKMIGSLNGIAIFLMLRYLHFTRQTTIDANLVNVIKEKYKLVEYQELIFKEIKDHNDKITNVLVSQSELLSKMTSVSVQSEKKNA